MGHKTKSWTTSVHHEPMNTNRGAEPSTSGHKSVKTQTAAEVQTTASRSNAAGKRTKRYSTTAKAKSIHGESEGY